MGAIIFEISALCIAVGFVIFLAYDDHKNQKIRAEEDRQKALAEKQESEQKERSEAE